MSKTINNIKQTALWKSLISALKNYPLCPIYVCIDGIAIKKQQDEYGHKYTDEIISLGKVINKEDKKESKYTPKQLQLQLT